MPQVEIQAIFHRADRYTREEAAQWCRSNDFSTDVYRERRDEGDVLTHHIHAQFDSAEAAEGTWRTIADDFPDGVSARTCERKGTAMDIVYTKGAQSADDPLTFVMSDETPDRVGDIIVAKGWSLEEFRKNPIALFGHDHNNIVGTWDDVKVAGRKLVGRLKLAKAGTSATVDTVRALVEQRILRSVSVGFQPKEFEPIKDREGRATGGYKFTKAALHECSLVAVPCNPNALAAAKSLGADRELLKTLFSDMDTGQATAPIDYEAKARQTGIALAKLNRSLRNIREFKS
jgi:HK97 family phage prohead protease